MRLKNAILLVTMLLCTVPSALLAQDNRPRRMTQEEFKAKQQEFITKEAGLTDAEAKEFFPLYFQLQEQKQNINEQAWELFRRGEDETTSEQTYAEILDGFVEHSLSADRLEKSFLTRFRSILSSKKIYKVKQAEMKFGRELVRGFRPRHKDEGRK